MKMGKKKESCYKIKIITAIVLFLLTALALFMIQMSRSGEVVIDAGHGGNDPGAIYGGISEKDVNLEIALKVKADLKKEGYRVVLTRKTDEFIGLYDRAGISNEKNARVFISIHCNAADNGGANGIEIYSMKDSEEGKKLAESVRKPVIENTGAKDLGVKQRNFAVLRATQCPAILVETGFLSNDNERWLLNSDEYQEKIADGIAKGTAVYLRSLMID